MGLSSADRLVLVHTIEDLAVLLRKRAGQKGTRLARLVEELALAHPGHGILEVMEKIGASLGRQTDQLLLSVGTHADVTRKLGPLNQASAQWLTTFFAVAEGSRGVDRALLNLEQLSADFVMESHHVVEHRARQFFPELITAFPAGPGDAGRAGAEAMITIAIPTELHRGSRYVPLEGQATRLAALRKTLPSRSFNLTSLLMSTFTDDVLRTVPFPAYLQELSAFYQAHLPDLYHAALPGGGAGGFREALVTIARKTGVPPTVLVP